MLIAVVLVSTPQVGIGFHLMGIEGDSSPPVGMYSCDLRLPRTTQTGRQEDLLTSRLAREEGRGAVTLPRMAPL